MRRGNNRNPSPATRFQKGKSGNPGGRPAGLLCKSSVEKLIALCYGMTKAQLKAIIENPGSSIMEIHIASIIAQGIKKGDLYSLNGLLDRTIGKVKDVVENHNHSHDDEFNSAPRGELVDILRRANASRLG